MRNGKLMAETLWTPGQIAEILDLSGFGRPVTSDPAKSVQIQDLAGSQTIWPTSLAKPPEIRPNGSGSAGQNDPDLAKIWGSIDPAHQRRFLAK